MSKAKKHIGASAIIILLAQNLLAPLAVAQSFQDRFDNEPRMMFYLTKGFGDSRKLESAPQLGLRFERSFQLDSGRLSLEPMQRPAFNQSLVDLRWTGGYGQSLHFFGAPVYRSPLQLNSSDIGDSSAEASILKDLGESSGGYGYAILIAIGLGAVLCAAEVVLCESSDSPRTPGSETSPGT